MSKITELEVEATPKKRITKVQLKVLKEIFSDASLTPDFLVKACGFIYLTTNANDCVICFEGGSNKVKIKGKLQFKVKKE